MNDRDQWLKTLIRRKIHDSINDEGSRVSTTRKNSLDRYLGEPYGDEEEDRSSFVTSEVYENVEWALAHVLEIFTINKRAVEFIAESEQDEDQAEQESDIVNYYIQHAGENNGFLLLHNWIKDILVYPNGYVKCWVEEKDEIIEDRLTGLTIQALIQLSETPDVEILESQSDIQFVDGYGQIELHEVKVRRTSKERKVRIESVPPDEVLIDETWTKLELEGCPFVCHRSRNSISHYVEMGYDFEELKKLTDVEDHSWSDERVNRLKGQEEAAEARNQDVDDPASRMLWMYEVSILADYDEDGRTERRRVVIIGDEIFENDIDNYQPIVSCASIVLPHKHVCMSYAKTVESSQLIITTLIRQLLDNVYATNSNRHFANRRVFNEGSVDQYLDPDSRLILVDGDPSASVMPEVNSSVVPDLLETISRMREQIKVRTGVAPEMSLDPELLQQTTASAYAGAMSSASQRLNMLVRVIAEVGYRPLMAKVHNCIRMHINQPASVKLSGKWVNFDPAAWKDRTKMRANVGLGSNNPGQKIALLRALLDLQREAMPQNLSDQAKIYTTLERMVEAADIGAASSYFTDPTEPGWQPPQPAPDPQAELFKAQAQALQQEQQRKAREAQAKAQSDMAKMQMEMQITKQQLEIDRQKFELDRLKFETVAEMDSNTNVAQLRETNANTALKQAQAVKAYADAGGAEAQARKAEVETSDDVRAAEEVLNSQQEAQ